MINKLEETSWDLENRDEQKKLIQKIMQYAIEIPADMIDACMWFCSKIWTSNEGPIFCPIFDGRAWLLRKEAIKKEGGLYSPLLGFLPPEIEDTKEILLL